MKPELPTGTVTFLFTDVEGSTKLLHELGAEDYSRALAEHRRILREAFAANGGVEVDTQGDAFFVAFPTAPGALAAAGAALDGLESGPIHVRVGIHSGTPHTDSEGYVGIDVHRAARIAACGHGGQVLVSASTAALAGANGLRDLGEHRLKDLTAPERIYQLGDGDFPPLKSLHRTNLPIPGTPFLGRGQELDEVHALVSREDVRLLTLTGPGGAGKTRLALQAAASASDSHPGGVFWVPLAPLRDPALVLEMAGKAVGVRNGLAEHIGQTATLLLFDNFEHVLEGADDLAGLLAACPGVHLLVTSREPLHVTGEQEYPVPPLARQESVEFFAARARAVKPDFGDRDAVAEICRRLDDLPLALELAAARVKALSPRQILERLEQRLPLLTGGARDAPERQRTLRATIAWSHDLLTPAEQELFARLAIFSGGCTLDAAEEICGADLDEIASLVDKSLIRRTGERYWMLETIREFATDRLEGLLDVTELRDRHAAWYVALGERAHPELRARRGREWLDRLDAEHANLRVSLEYLLAFQDKGRALRLSGAIWMFWATRGHWAEGRRFLLAALALDGDVNPELLIDAFWGAAILAIWQGDLDEGEQWAMDLLELSREEALPRAEAVAVHTLAMAATDRDRERALYEESLVLARGLDDGWLVSAALNNLGGVYLREHAYERAIELFEESLAIGEARGDLDRRARELTHLGHAVRGLGDLTRARVYFRSGLAAAGEIGLVDIELDAVWGLASLEAAAGDAGIAARLVAWVNEQVASLGAAGGTDDLALEKDLLERLGPDRLSSELAVGAALTREEAIDLALGPNPATPG